MKTSIRHSLSASAAVAVAAMAILSGCEVGNLGGSPPPGSPAGLRELPLPGLVFSDMSYEPAGEEPGVTRARLEVRAQEGRPTAEPADAHPSPPSGPALQSFSAAFKLHGESSIAWPKKSMGLELRDDASPLVSHNAQLLGLPEENDYVLHSLFSDKSLMRNYLAYALAGEIMDWAPRARFVELWGAQPEGWLGADYQGIYLLCEKIKIDRSRVAVLEPGPGVAEDPAAGGGYIFRIDKPSLSDWTIPGLKTLNLTVLEPKAAALTEGQKDYVAGYFRALEDCLRSTPAGDWRAYLDEASFMDFFMINELFKNVDGYRLSTYMHKDRGGKLEAGPVWDFDLSSGNDGRAVDTEGWEILLQLDPAFPDYDYNPAFWWCEMLHDEAFRSGLRARWGELRRTSLSDSHIASLIDAAAAKVLPGIGANFACYPCLRRGDAPEGTDWWTPWDAYESGAGPAAVFGDGAYSYGEHLEYFRRWLAARMAWMDSGASWDAIDAWAEAAELHLDQGGNL